MMGPWLIFASLMNRATIALFYGSPTGPDFCRFVQDAKVTMLGLVPSLVKAWRQADATKGIDWSRLKCFSSTGETSNQDDMFWLMSQARGYRPVIEYCGGTEIGGGYICGTLVQPASPSTFTTPAFGLGVMIINERGEPTEQGELVIIPPSIGLSIKLLNKDHYQVYHAGMPKGPHGETLRRHGDEMQVLSGGFYRAQGRVDDTMNLGGIKISSAEIERCVNEVAGVRETAAVAVSPTGGGPSLLVIYAVMGGEEKAENIKNKMQKAIKTLLNPLFRIHEVCPIDALPRTASNKVMRRVLRARYAQNK